MMAVVTINDINSNMNFHIPGYEILYYLNVSFNFIITSTELDVPI